MAKKRPVRTLSELQRVLGYEIGDAADANDCGAEYYSDLRPVPNDIYAKTVKDVEEFGRTKDLSDAAPGTAPLYKMTFWDDGGSLLLSESSRPGFHRFTLDLHHSSGVDLRLRLTKQQAIEIKEASKIVDYSFSESKAPLLSLPRELRDSIYKLLLPSEDWILEASDLFNRVTFPRAICEPTGYRFSIYQGLNLLGINKQIRSEVLTAVYQNTRFRLDDIDESVRVLLAIGRLGRANIRSIELCWKSTADDEQRWERFPGDEDKIYTTLPSLHVNSCICLLWDCEYLTSLHLLFEQDIISRISLAMLQADPGIRDLCLLKHSKNLEIKIWSATYDPIEDCENSRWLKAQFETAGQ